MASITINDVHGFTVLVTELVEKVGKKFMTLITFLPAILHTITRKTLPYKL